MSRMSEPAWVYLDHNATTPPAPQVVRAVEQAQRELWANPSSVHRFGQMVRQKVELARAAVARLLGARDRDIVFTSGGTESNNLALRGVLDTPASSPSLRVLITTAIEHSAVREPAQHLAQQGVTLEHLHVDGDGVVSVDHALELLARYGKPGAIVLLSVQWANNETGVIQPVALLGQAVRAARTPGARVLFHCDATQAVGKIPVNVADAGVDLLTLAGHKFHGPKGVGALFVGNGVRLFPQQRGGPQERDRRGGTENTSGILGLGVAAELARDFVHDAAAIALLRGRRDRLEQLVRAALPDTVVNSGGGPGRSVERLWNTSNLGFPGLEAEAILLGLSERGVCASAGAACSSGSLEPSPVLKAMGVPEPIAHGSVRFSLSRDTRAEEIDAAAAAVGAVVQRLARTLPLGR
jgi:cysteine desulfurase